MKQKIEVIDLELGIEVNNTPPICESTLSKINEKIDVCSKEQEIIERVKEKKERAIEQCFQKLLETAQTDGVEIDQKTLLAIAGTNNVISLMLGIKNLMRKRGNLWVIVKHKRGATVYYSFRPS